MKNLIEFYYNVNVYSITLKEFNYYINDNDYVFYYVKNVPEIDYKVIEYCSKMGFNTLLKNKFNDYVTMCDNSFYLLIRIDNKINSDFKIEKTLYNCFISPIKFDFVNWNNLWIQKSRYYKNIVFKNNTSIKNKSICEYFYQKSIFAIAFFNEFCKKDKCFYVLSHKRINFNMLQFDFFNPLNVIFDVKERDLSELIKNKLFKDNFNINNFILYLKKINKMNVNYYLIISRLLFPSYYYDFIDNTYNASNFNDIDIVFKEKIYNNNLKKIITLLLDNGIIHL